jgi:hypothetical protein
MTNNEEKLSDFEKKVEEEINQARIRLSTEIPATQREVVLAMGAGLEKLMRGERKSSICEELKHRLREEILRGLISRRTIEAYCKPEWKRQDMVAFGKLGSELKKRKAAKSTAHAAPAKDEGEPEAEPEDSRPEILVGAQNSGEQLTSDLPAGKYIPGKDELAQQLRQKDEKIAEQSRQIAELMDIVDGYKAKADHYQQEVDSAGLLDSGSKNDEPKPNPNLEFEFSLPFESLHAEMQRCFKLEGSAARVWLNGLLDLRSGIVLSCGVGRLGEFGTD